MALNAVARDVITRVDQRGADGFERGFAAEVPEHTQQGAVILGVVRFAGRRQWGQRRRRGLPRVLHAAGQSVLDG